MKHIKIQHAAHAVMVAFMLASLANVYEFFLHMHGNIAVAGGLGFALGIGLVVMAWLLSGMAWNWRDPRFLVIATVTTALALIGGGIQAAAYAQHMPRLAAIIVGLSLPVVGELGVALAVSAYQEAMRFRRMADAQSQLADGVRLQIGEAVAIIDKSKIEQQVNRAATLVTKAIVDSTIADMLAELQRNRPASGNDESGDSATAEPAICPNPASDTPGNLQLANEKRQRQIAERQNAIAELLASYGTMGVAGLVEALQNDRNIEASERTIRDDCKSLEESGRIIKQGRGVWDIARSIEVIPAPVEFATNGKH